MRDTVDDVVLVSEESLLEAICLLHAHAGLVTEPAGVAGVAALLEHPTLRSGSPATIVCGGNLAPDLAARLLVHG
jgi:threonine dehydratase